jgi:hypothetical protein
MRLGWLAPAAFLFGETFFAADLRGFSRINQKQLRIAKSRGCARAFCLGRVFAGLPQNLFGLHSFCTNHFAFRFIFAYAEMGEWLTVVTHGNF